MMAENTVSPTKATAYQPDYCRIVDPAPGDPGRA